MAISVGELVGLPHLQATVLGGRGGLDNVVTWVHTSDLVNAWEWHGSGELLLTNGTGLPPQPEGQVAFVTRLAGTGASGLALGLGMTGPPLTPELVAMCDEVGLPLLSVPFNVPFTAVVRAVADANEREESRQLLMVARLYELLRQNIGANSGLLDRLGDELGVRLELVDPASGFSLQEGAAPCEYATELVAGFADHGGALPGMLVLRVPDLVRGEPGAVAVSVPGDKPAALVVVPARGELPSTVLLQHAAAGAALELAQQTARGERRRREGAELFAQLLDRRLPEAVAERELAGFGLRAADSVIVAVRVRAGGPEQLSGVRGPHLAMLRPPHLLLLLRDEEADFGIGSEARGTSAAIVAVGRIAEAVGEAVWALVAAENDRVTQVRFSGTSPLSPRTPAEARSLTRSVLGVLLDFDETSGSALVPSLEAFLECDRSWARAAGRLHVHKQTLGYRLRKIETLTGRGFISTADLAHWWLALRALHMLTADSQDGGHEPDVGSVNLGAGLTEATWQRGTRS